MIFSARQYLGPAARYFAFNGVLMLCNIFVIQEITRISVTLAPDLRIAVDDPSRVEQFKQAEVAAAKAPNVPVPRVIVADSLPDMPVQVLAVRLDQAESLKVTPLKLKRKPSLRTAKSARKKSPVMAGGKLPPIVVDLASSEAGVLLPKTAKKKADVVESSRDITNRSLGVLVALKN
jgi:hypothetical protein